MSFLLSRLSRALGAKMARTGMTRHDFSFVTLVSSTWDEDGACKVEHDASQASAESSPHTLKILVQLWKETQRAESFQELSETLQNQVSALTEQLASEKEARLSVEDELQELLIVLEERTAELSLALAAEKVTHAVTARRLCSLQTNLAAEYQKHGVIASALGTCQNDLVMSLAREERGAISFRELATQLAAEREKSAAIARSLETCHKNLDKSRALEERAAASSRELAAELATQAENHAVTARSLQACQENLDRLHEDASTDALRSSSRYWVRRESELTNMMRDVLCHGSGWTPPFSEEIVEARSVGFTHDTIRPVFGDGRSVQHMVEDLGAGRLDPRTHSNLVLDVVRFKNGLRSLNNRRLWALREHQRRLTRSESRKGHRRQAKPVMIRVRVFDLCPLTAKFFLSNTSCTCGESVEIQSRRRNPAALVADCQANAAAAEEMASCDEWEVYLDTETNKTWWWNTIEERATWQDPFA
eukprot:TRINITY_DN7566_c0_g1_i1.p1 TRINITY_DN7566_c0_g1~~TRINITY_DN7566_c0_g1_i1.p1  ORF type:complete len:478 (-),score=61.02 TRINITY_DN7566_c0_g1_i1:101-1534(-)